MAVKNSTILEKAWLQGTNDFQQRIPDPTQSAMSQVVDALFDPMNRMCLNQFIDTLVNRIGRTIVRSKRWDNVLRAFKQDNLIYGNTIQEIAPKWIKAHSYLDNDETLLKLNRPEAQAWYHSVSRQDRYDISIIEVELRRAFTQEYGLNEFVSAIMAVPQSSDNYDEYLCMKQLIATYENRWGFYKHNVSAVVDEASGKELLTAVRTYAGKLQFPSTLYNCSEMNDIPVFAKEDELILITTPEVEASLDVNTLASVFQLDKADLKYHKVIIDEFPIAGAVALLTTKDWFVVHDVVYETTSFYNAQTLAVNYYLHHHEIVSCSPFVPAILFTTNTGTENDTIVQNITGLKLYASVDGADPVEKISEAVGAGATIQLIPKLQGTVTPNDTAIEVSPDSVTYILTADFDKNSNTYVDRNNVLHIQKSGLGDNANLNVYALSTYVNPSGDIEEIGESIDVPITANK